MAAKNNPSARKTEVVVQELKGEVLIYDLQNNKAYCLNDTSALVYRLCDGNNSASEISNHLSRKLKQPVTEDLVWLALDQLKKDNLVENGSEIESNFNGLSRREVIRKVGFASMIALPVISSLIAPTAAMAQSGTAAATCTPGTDASGLGQGSGCGCPGGTPNGVTCGAGGANATTPCKTGCTCRSVGVCDTNICIGTCI